MGAPFGERERVCHLITHHQLPFFLIDLDEPERRIHLISYQTRCDLLTIHANADARGRIARDLSQILDNVALFHALCEEQGCLHSPRRFASDHSRFLYFRKEGASVDHEAYDDWENRVTLMSGLPASGKDSWIAANATQKDVISLDALRTTLGVAPWQPQGAVIVAARERAREALRAGRTFVWNATNLSRHLRGTLIDLCAAYRAKVDIVYVETGSEELARRNSERTEPVPTKANERMFERWEVPELTECHTLQTALS
jgi:predicted kinase